MTFDAHDSPVSSSLTTSQVQEAYALGDANAPAMTSLESAAPQTFRQSRSSEKISMLPTTDSPSTAFTADGAIVTRSRPTSGLLGADQSTSPQATPDASPPPKMEYKFVGLDGSPIRSLNYRLQSNGAIVDGATNDEGNSASVTAFAAGADCSVSVKTDTGEYKQVACFTVPSADSTITLMSPSVLLETSTEVHGGVDADVYNEPPVETPADTDGSAVHPAYADDGGDAPAQGNSAAAGSNAFSSADSAGGRAGLHASAASAALSTSQSTTLTANAAASSASSPKPNTAKTASQAALSKTSMHAPTQPLTAVSPKGGSGKTPGTLVVATKRDAVGHPQAQPQETWGDWAGHKINAAWHFIEDWMSLDANPVAGKSSTFPATSGATPTQLAGVSDLSAIAKKTSEVAEEQTTHTMPSSSTVVNLKQIADGTITYGAKASKESKGQCYMFVKIALWKVNAIRFIREKNGKFEGAGGSYAKVAGAFLESQGFENVTSELPDARWALPGDVIVYRVAGDPEIADGKGQPGHIDIRTYHYYVSDFKRNYLCVGGRNPDGTRHFYEPVGIYRKEGFSDPLPLARMKAFLKIIRSREAKTFFELGGDSKTYYASQGVYSLSGAIKDLSTYPPGAHHQGAYQMTKAAWTAGQRLDMGALPADFQPATQDRYAVFLMEGRPGRINPKTREPQPTALGYVRTGEVEKAVELLRSEWACMPGTSQDQGYTMAQLRSDFEKYIKEFSN